MSISLIILLIAMVIGFNIWNAYNLNQLIKRPLRSDALNDKNYWELKYKMQYMVTVFSIILFIAAYLGYSTVQNAKDGMRKEFQANLDSLNMRVDSFKFKLTDYRLKADSQFSRVDSIGNILHLLGIRQKEVSTYVSVTYKTAEDLASRVTELMKNDQIRQNMYVVESIPYVMDTPDAAFKRYYFKDYKTVNGSSLPMFSKPPYVVGISKEGSGFTINNITDESFTLSVYAYASERDLSKPFLITLLIIEYK